MANVLIPSDVPVYRLLQPFYGPDDNLYETGAVIRWTHEPNEDMEPLNDLARDRMMALCERLDEEARKVAEKSGKAFVKRPRGFEDVMRHATTEARRVELVRGDGGMPVMGARKDLSDTIGTVTDEYGREADDVPHIGTPDRPLRKGRGTLSLSKIEPGQAV